MSVYQVKHPHHRNAPRVEHEPLILQASVNGIGSSLDLSCPTQVPVR
jgi:hypothetical protein